MKKLGYRYACLSILSQCIFLFLATIFSFQPLPVMAPDSTTYMKDATNLIQHKVFSKEDFPPYVWEPYRTPGYPILIAMSKALFGSEKFILLFSVLFSGIGAWAVVQISGVLGASETGQNISGLLFTLMPNSLGLSTFMLTDAIFGYLFVVWIYLLILGFFRNSKKSLSLSIPILLILQSIKPTLNIGFLFIIGFAILQVRDLKRWFWTAILVGCALVLPLIFSLMNYRDNGVFSASFLGVQTTREYLQVRYIVEQTGINFSEITDLVRNQDATAALQLTDPPSYYGRLYLIKEKMVTQFFQQHPFDAIKLMSEEMIIQFAAPQDFAFLVFLKELPIWTRIIGGIFSLFLWIGAGLGAWILFKKNNWKLALVLLVTLAFFLTTGSVSHYVGSRLRFPADLLSVPFWGFGISTFFSKFFLKSVS